MRSGWPRWTDSKRRFSWQEARETVLAAFARFHPRMAETASAFGETLVFRQIAMNRFEEAVHTARCAERMKRGGASFWRAILIFAEK